MSASVEDGWLQVRVKDTGIGIAEAQQERIFEAFEQADASVEREYGGTGLGLAVTRQLVELHGGTIGAWSRPWAPARPFFFSLPLAAGAPADGVPVRTAPAGESAAFQDPVEHQLMVPKEDGPSPSLLDDLESPAAAAALPSAEVPPGSPCRS